jgi:hypothetical protein
MKLPNISDYHVNKDLLILTIAILAVDVFVICLARYYPNFFGKDLNDWYDKFTLAAVMSDVLIILIGFMIARYVYTEFVSPTYGYNPLLFIALVVLIQAIHDVFFYVAVIKPIPEKHNTMMDVFKSYAKNQGIFVVGGDALLMIGSALTALALKSQSDHVISVFGVLVAYTLPYILYTKPQWR